LADSYARLALRSGFTDTSVEEYLLAVQARFGFHRRTQPATAAPQVMKPGKYREPQRCFQRCMAGPQHPVPRVRLRQNDRADGQNLRDCIPLPQPARMKIARPCCRI